MSSPEHQQINKKPDLLVIVGPTAVGKTDVSIQLAKRVHGEIISADSRLFYRGMDIGTAKPSPEDREKIPHYLIDVAEPNESWSLGIYQKKVHALIQEINERGKIPFLVGGTGQYVRAVVEGWQVPPLRPNPALRRILDQWGKKIGPPALHQRLRFLDPKAASRIEPNNLRRTVRALEVIFITGERFSAQRTRANEPPYNFLIIGLHRERTELFERIDARINTMLAEGWLDEVQALLNAGYSQELPGMSAIGYRQLAQVVEEESTLEEAVSEIKRLTRQFVRRQANWFKKTDPRITWVAANNLDLDELEALIRTKFSHKFAD